MILTAEDEALIKRWNDFSGKIKDRFYAVLDEAEAQCMQILSDENYKTQPLLVGWQGLKSQLHMLIQKLDDTWQNQVAPYNNYDEPWYTMQNQLYADTNEMHRRLSNREGEIMGRCSEAFYQHAIRHYNRDFLCSQCRAPITVNNDIFHAHYVTCSYCNRVNTYEPPTQIREIEWFCVDNLAAYRNREKKQQLDEATQKITSARVEEDKRKAWAELELLHKDYYTAFLQERISILPAQAAFFEKDMEGKMREFYQFKAIHTT